MQAIRKLLTKPILIDLLVLIFITLFLFSYFKPQLLFLKTTINGGDTGSHFHSAVYLKEVLLPQGKIMGWDQGNLCGFPHFYHYFPLPFLLMALLSNFFVMEIAFKLVTIFGIILLPFATYLSFRLLKYPFPAPILAALFTLPFLFNQGGSMSGGNIPSVLAGEFCYCLGMSLAILFLGTLFAGITEKKWIGLNASLFFLAAFSHAFALIAALIFGSFFLVFDFKKNLRYLLATYGLGGLLLAFWFLPVLSTLPYVTSYVVHWTYYSLLEVFPASLLPFLALSAFAFFENKKDPRNNYYIYIALGLAFFYFIGPRIGYRDDRMIPYLQLLLTIYGAANIPSYLEGMKNIKLFPIIAFLLIALWVSITTSYIPTWIEWNYSGFEQKKPWPVFHSINEYLKANDLGRVVWERTTNDEAFGTVRAYECLPYFAKRNTLEGIHMLGGITTPFIYYNESEISDQACRPLPAYFNSTLDLRAGINHFNLLNISHFVVRSDIVKKLIKKYPEMRLEKTFGDYQVYRFMGNHNSYVEPLKNEPVLFPSKDWRDVSYQWFANPKAKDIILVFDQATPANKKLISQTAFNLAEVKAISLASPPVVTSTISNESVDITTSKVGWPLLVKISYHPNWKVTGADKIYFCSPSFMLIFPTQNKVHLQFEPGTANVVGNWLSIIGLILLITSPYWSARLLKAGGTPDLSVSANKTAIITVGSIALLLLAANQIFPDRDMIVQAARRAFNSNNYHKSYKLFTELAQSPKLSDGLRDEGMVFAATSLVRENYFSEGAKQLRNYIAQYPASFWTPQATYDLAKCERSLGNTAEAKSLFIMVISDYPNTLWSKWAVGDLKGLNAPR
jgi:hypothetical protein